MHHSFAFREEFRNCILSEIKTHSVILENTIGLEKKIQNFQKSFNLNNNDIPLGLKLVYFLYDKMNKVKQDGIKRCMLFAIYLLQESILNNINIDKIISSLKLIYLIIQGSKNQLSKSYFYDQIKLILHFDQQFQSKILEAIHKSELFLFYETNGANSIKTFNSISTKYKTIIDKNEMVNNFYTILLIEDSIADLPNVVPFIKKICENNNLIIIAKNFSQDLISTIKIRNLVNNNEIKLLCINEFEEFRKNILYMENITHVTCDTNTEIVLENVYTYFYLDHIYLKTENNLGPVTTLVEISSTTTKYNKILSRLFSVLNATTRGININLGSLYTILEICNILFENTNNEEYNIIKRSVSKITVKSIFNGCNVIIDQNNIDSIKNLLVNQCIFESSEEILSCIKNTICIISILNSLTGVIINE